MEGKPFTVLCPDEPPKHLGVRMTMLGDFTAEKAHVLTVMGQRSASLSKDRTGHSLVEDRTLSRPEKEQIIITGICSVFRYSAFIVDWSTTELDNITRSWITAYKQTWSLPNGAGSNSHSPKPSRPVVAYRLARTLSNSRMRHKAHGPQTRLGPAAGGASRSTAARSL